ncbi:MAG: ComF family protein [Candidatus Eisenbacteria bacterium]|nr:ComF family protein [Candidatus Eisenbacteria bacterium]
MNRLSALPPAVIGALRRFALPASCRACGAPVDLEFLCPSCASQLVPAVCALELPRDGGRGPRHAFYGLRFTEAARALVHAIKFDGHTSAAGVLAEKVLPVCRVVGGSACDAVVPVPLHPVRERERGFNQSSSIARELAGRLGLDVIERGLTRTRPTRPQTDLGRAERLVNVREAFRAGRSPLSGSRVLLVDDVITTGSTLAAASSALLAAGAESVIPFAATGRPETG